jgi:hypothetical protein
VNNIQHFQIQLAEINFEVYTEPPEDPLGELSDLEMNLRRFCYEYNQPVFLTIFDEKVRVFLEPDICLILDKLPQKIANLAQGKSIEICFTESACRVIKFIPFGDRIICHFRSFGSFCEEKTFELYKPIVLSEFSNFLERIMDLAVEKSYISIAEKNYCFFPSNPRKFWRFLWVRKFSLVP